MTNTHKKRKTNKHSSTKKMCPIGLKPFEEEFSKKFQLKKSSSEKKAFVKQLLSKFAPNSIKPENSFYDYINYQWLKNVSLDKQQKYITQIDDFRLTQHQVYEQLNGIILDYIKHNDNKLAKNLKNFYNSIIKMNPREYTRRLAKEAVQKVDDLIAEGNPWKMLAFFNSDEMIARKAPFVWALNPDDKNTKVYTSYLSAHKFTILDLNVYFDDGTDVEYKRKYRREFVKSCQKTFNTLLGSDKSLLGQDIYDVEVSIFNALGCTDITAEVESTYNKISAGECLSKYGFDWKEFTHCL